MEKIIFLNRKKERRAQDVLKGEKTARPVL